LSLHDALPISEHAGVTQNGTDRRHGKRQLSTAIRASDPKNEPQATGRVRRLYVDWEEPGGAVAVLLALGSSVLWGSADFSGGLLSRRRPVLAGTWASQALALVALVRLAGGQAALARPGRDFGGG